MLPTVEATNALQGISIPVQATCSTLGARQQNWYSQHITPRNASCKMCRPVNSYAFALFSIPFLSLRLERHLRTRSLRSQHRLSQVGQGMSAFAQSIITTFSIFTSAAIRATLVTQVYMPP